MLETLLKLPADLFIQLDSNLLYLYFIDEGSKFQKSYFEQLSAPLYARE